MFKITLHNQSNEKGIYITEIATATEFKKGMKLDRMYDRWLKILCPHVEIDKYYSNLLYLNMPNPYRAGFESENNTISFE